MIPPVSDSRLREFASESVWYHTLELAPGVRTRAVFDHDRYTAAYRFPSSLAGRSVLDVGAADGYFSFLFERLGADRVLAVDTNTFTGSVATEPSPARAAGSDAKYARMAATNREFSDVYASLGVPVGHQLLAARALLSSRIEHRTLSVYDLDQLGEQFDFVFCGDLVQHLKNPLAALEALARVTRGECVVALGSELPMGGSGTREATVRNLARALKVALPSARQGVSYVGNTSGRAFFQFAPGAFEEALLASGFRSVERLSEFRVRDAAGNSSLEVVYRALP